MSIQRITTSPQQTEQLAAELARRLQGGDIVTLEGPLGAGKTCFVRGLARGLGLDPGQVSSPTFAITQEYTQPNQPTLVHIDAYRLHGQDELETIGWEELVACESIIIALEWPSRIAAALADLRCIEVTIEPAAQHRRIITMSAHEDLSERLGELP